MTIGIVIFAYNRPDHLSKVLDGLRKNEGVTDIYIYQDGLKKETDRKCWEQTKRVIELVDWCHVEYCLSAMNKGLAKSIMEGVTKVLEEKDAVIVLEDDCVPAPDFINYMRQCLEQYKANGDVYCVTGYSYPVDMDKDYFDIYFVGRCNSWGWGTWKERWDEFKPNNSILEQFIYDKEKSLYLATWGNDLEQMLCDRLAGRNDSWAVYWALHIIAQGGVNVVPYKSLIQNIGMDGTGTHCGVTDLFDTVMDLEDKKTYKFPQEAVVRDDARKIFLELYGGWTVNNQDTSKKHILIYGLGTYFKRNEKYICDHYYIEAFIERSRTGFYAGKEIITVDKVSKYKNCKIWVMILDMQECQRVANELKDKYGVLSENIWLIGGNYF